MKKQRPFLSTSTSTTYEWIPVIVFHVVLFTSSNLTFGRDPFRHIMRHIVVVVVVIVLNDRVCVTSVGHACSSRSHPDVAYWDAICLRSSNSSPDDEGLLRAFATCLHIFACVYFRWLTLLFSYVYRFCRAVDLLICAEKAVLFTWRSGKDRRDDRFSHSAFHTSDSEFERSSGLV